MRTGKALGTAMLWNAACVAIVLLGPGRALGAPVEVDAHSAHEAVWKVYGAGKSGTAFAIGDHHFLTCAHVIKDFSDHGAKEVFINQHGSEDSRTLRVNYGHVALTLVQDIALFTTKETVGHYFALAQTSATEGATGLRAMGHPLGLRMEVLRQTEPITYHNEFQLEIPADKITRGGLSGSPVFRDDGKVVGMHCEGGGNMSIAVKVEHLRRFLDGNLAWTACRDSPSVAACIERATTQTRDLAEAGDRVAQYQLGRDDGHLDKDPAMLRRAAEGGFSSAQFSMGMVLKERKQWTEAARWFRLSAAQEDPAKPVPARVGALQRTWGGSGPRACLRAHAPGGPYRIRHRRVWRGIAVQDGARDGARCGEGATVVPEGRGQGARGSTGQAGVPVRGVDRWGRRSRPGDASGQEGQCPLWPGDQLPHARHSRGRGTGSRR